MIAFAILDSNGIPTGGGMAPDLPEGAVPLPEGYRTTDLRRLRFRDGAWEERSDLTPALAPTRADLAAREAAVLAQARAEATARINARTDAFRRRYYTAIAGQDALYLEKRAEALAYIREAEQSGEPATLEDYPLIQNEVGVTAPTAWQLAQIWLHLSAAFRSIGAATERPRQVALNAIATAPDEETLMSIAADFAQALATLETALQTKGP